MTNRTLPMTSTAWNSLPAKNRQMDLSDIAVKKDGASVYDRLGTILGARELSVKDFGATGDGVTDDTAAIVRAAAALTSGKTLFFPRGTYLVSQTDAVGTTADYGKKVIGITNKTDVTIRGDGATIKCVAHDISNYGGLMFIWIDDVQRCLIEGFYFDMTFTGRNTTAEAYPFCGAIIASDGTSTGAKAQTALTSDIVVRDCIFKLYHPYGQFSTTSNAYNGDANNGYKLFSVFFSGDYLSATYETQNRNATIENCTWKNGHNGYGAWVWAYNNVRFKGLRAESYVAKYSDSDGAYVAPGVAFIRYHQFLCSGVEVSGCDYRAKPSSERTATGMQGAGLFCTLDTNQTGDYSHGDAVVCNNRIFMGNGDAAHTAYDYGISVYTYGNTIIKGNTFDGDAADTTNAYAANCIYLGYTAVGGDGKATAIVDGNIFSVGCKYCDGVVLSNGSADTAYKRRLKSLIVTKNISYAQSQYLVNMTGGAAVTYLGVLYTQIEGNVIIGTHSYFDKNSTNSRALLLAANQAGDVLIVRDNIIVDKNKFMLDSDVSASAIVTVEQNICSGVTTESNSGVLYNARTVIGTAAPGAGTWKVGDRVRRKDSTTGAPPGWYCTVAGTPGTWKAEANLA